MTRPIRFAVLVSGVVLAGGCGAGNQAGLTSADTSPAAPAGEWIALFDGQSLRGWQARPTSNPRTTGDWKVENGALVCGGSAPSWIHTDDEYADFRLQLEFRGADSVNSGVFLRSQKEGQPHRTGYELQIWDYQTSGYNTGSLVNYVFAPPAPPIVPNQWNRYDITVQGDHFLVVLNDSTILDARDGTHARGVVGLQCQAGYPIEFRNIRIQPLN